MCGIAGTLDWDETRGLSRVRRINDRQAHRGPDHQVVARAGSFVIGNSRLAIQDRSPTGNQPFFSRDGRFICVFNGEIYNYLELIDEHQLSRTSRCDGAIIPELWSRFGSKALNLLRGMYAIAVVDLASDTLTLCRDPFGIKPLYFRRLPDGTLVFGSEPRPLAAIHPSSISAASVCAYLHFGSIPSGMSPFEEIEALDANSIAVVDKQGALRTSPIVAGDHPLLDVDSLVEPADLASSFREVVQMHLRSDAPTVLLLSAGVDSASLAAVAREVGQDLECMTVENVGADDESAEAARTARHYGHRHKVVRPELTPNDVGRFFRSMQRPTIDGLNTFIVCEAVKAAGFRVALSGLGADEALGGYRHYRLLPWLRGLALVDRVPGLGRLGTIPARRLSRANGDKLARLLAPDGPRSPWDLDVLQREVFSRAQVEAMTGLGPQRLGPPGRRGSSAPLIALIEAEIANYLQAMLLPDADAFSMCSSVELRVPYLDRAFFASGASVALSRPRRGKRVLTDALKDPQLLAISRRPKSGFSLPMARWMRDGPLLPFVQDLASASAPVWQYVSRQVLPSAVSQLSMGRWSPLWSIAALNGWLLTLDAVSLADG
jgi:asparagine synthase (glutamine-hydrolysing)